MVIDIAIQSEPLHLAEEISSGSGAIVRFEGRVRPEEKGSMIEALVYEAYEPMAQNQMRKIVEELAQTHYCLSVRIRHRIGVVPVGEMAILIETSASHRAEAFALTAAFMDRLKQEVPIWKLHSLPRES